MKVLSLFDGMSCGRIALDRVGIKPSRYFSFEIDKYAIQVSNDNWDDVIQLGSVTGFDFKRLGQIDLLQGGSPCQGFSFAGKQLNFNDPRSALFFEFVRALKEVKPKYFLLENVRMKKEYEAVISEHLGVEPILINSSLVSAQNRQRLYWTNIPGVTQPEDKKIFLKDIIEHGVSCVNISSSSRGHGKIETRISNAYKSLTLTKTGYSDRSRTLVYVNSHGFNRGGFQRVDKSKTIGRSTCRNIFLINNEEARQFTTKELCRLQTVPDEYCKSVSHNKASALLGNGWTVDVMAHIYKGLK